MNCICTHHGLAWINGDLGCPKCAADKTERRFYELVLVSKTVPRKTREGGVFDGKNGRPFIGEVFILSGVWSLPEYKRHIATFEAEHGTIANVTEG